MAIQGFDKEFYLNAKLAQLQNDPQTAADWADKDAAFLEARLENGFGLTALQHYEQFGFQENLGPNAFFNPAEYIRAKATAMFNDPSTSYLTIDEAAEDFVNIWNGNVYNHYLQFGESENVNPSNAFDVSSYLEAKLAQLQETQPEEWAGRDVSDVAAAFEASGLTALGHFLAFGQGEGLTATPVPEGERVVVEEGENPNQGETFNLTAGPDSLTGTNLNDTFNALTVRADGTPDTTLSAFDSIDGGAGEDTLNIYTDNVGGLNDEFPASASVQNVEIVNILNADGAAAFGDASDFEGVEQLWQVNSATAVTNLQATTTAGFRNTEQNVAVTAAAAAASATIALDGAQGATTSDFDVDVDGEALNTVNVAGSIEDGDANDGVGASINLDVTVGENEQTVTVNTAVDTTLTVDDSGSTDEVTSVDASASTGGVTFVGDAAVADIATGEGDDDVTLNTLFSATVTAASVVTGAGDDTITIDTTAGTGNITDAGDITVDAGEGDDTVIVADIDAISTGSVIDGGEGTDTLQTAGGTLDAEDYTLLNNVFVNFEELTFTAASAFDASRLAGYNEFNLQAGSTGATGVVKVAENQALTTGGNLTATAAGYDATDTDNVVYAGTLDITATANATVTAQAEAVNLTVNATEAAATAAVLTGDVQEATININNFVGDAPADFKAASVTVETVTGGALDALTSLTLAGNGAATVTNNADTALVTVDASALNTVDGNGDAATGLIYTSSNALAETITLGDGIDALTFNAGASTVAAMDSIVSFNLATNDAGAFDAAASDDLDFAGSTAATAIGEVSAANLDLALVDVASNAGAADGVIFDFGGDTYVFQDADGNSIVNDDDALIQLVGGVDQDLLVDMFAVV